MNWYVVHCLTGREEEVRSRIQDSGIKAVVPRRLMKERCGGVWREVERVLFPGYVFILAGITPHEYYAVRYVPGAIRLLPGRHSRPLPLPEEEVTLILQLTMNGDTLGLSEVFVEGGRVTVVSGPLKGLEGHIVKLDARRFRARVNISIMGEPRIVDLAASVIEKS